MSIYSQEKKFYVYQYIRNKDSKNGLAGTPYYIGKGCGDRAYAKNHGKHICVPNEHCYIIIVSSNMTEVDAYQLEILLIEKHGRIDLNTGCLHNRNAGSNNPRNISKESVAKMIETKRKNGTLKRTKESITKGIETRIKNGTLNTNSPESVALGIATKKEKGIVNGWTTSSALKAVELKEKMEV